MGIRCHCFLAGSIGLENPILPPQKCLTCERPAKFQGNCKLCSRGLQMISCEWRTIKKEAALQPARTDRTTPPLPPPYPSGVWGRLIHCNLSDLQNSMEITSCDLTHIFSLKAFLQVACARENLIDPAQNECIGFPPLCQEKGTKERDAASSTPLRLAQKDSTEGGPPVLLILAASLFTSSAACGRSNRAKRPGQGRPRPRRHCYRRPCAEWQWDCPCRR